MRWLVVYAVEFLCRGLAYQRWSSYSQIPYLCHPFRTFLVNLDSGMAAGGLDPREAVAFVEGFRDKLLKTLLRDLRVSWEPRLPSLLGAVLRQCHSRGEIIGAALQVRDSDEARSYRSFMAETNSELRTGKMKKLLKYSKERAKLERDLLREFGVREGGRDVAVSFWIISMNFDLPGLLYRPVYLRPHLRLIYNLSKAVARISSLRPHFQRLFGLVLLR